MKTLMFVAVALAMFVAAGLFIGCDYDTTTTGSSAQQVRRAEAQENQRTRDVGARLIQNQPTPTDIEYSLERHNMIRRAYWVNGQREKARMMANPIANTPLGYVILFTNNGAVVGRFIVEGKVSSLNNWLAPTSEYYEIATGSTSTIRNRWLPDSDGGFGSQPDGIYFFTPDGRYIEWNGTFLYSDIPFEVKDPILRVTQ